MNKKSITVKHIGYVVTGLATVTLWSGETGAIDMDSTQLGMNELTKENILSAINDGRYGCESINCANIAVYDLYERNVRILHRAWRIDCMRPAYRQQFMCRGI